MQCIWSIGIALVDAGIALALLSGGARKVTDIGSIVWSLLIWTTAEGLGRTHPGEIATDIGAAITPSGLPGIARCGSVLRYPFLISLDVIIERRLPWWLRVAEIGR